MNTRLREYPSSHLSERLRAIDSFFSALPVDSMDQVPEVLRPVAQMKAGFHRQERRITFLGAAKSGKTTVLNALLGTGLLPVHAFRTSRHTTTLGYGQEPTLIVVQQGGVEEAKPFDALRDFGGEPRGCLAPNPDLQEVRVLVPLPLLASGATLLDTPGLLVDHDVASVVLGEIHATDLAVMVLAADKILSAEERAIAARVNDLLHGNIVFVVNRLDLVDEAEREEVIEWARTAVRDSGNHLVGRPRLFGKTASTESTSSGNVATDLHAWLTDFVSAEWGYRACMLSRLGVLERRLQEAIDVLLTSRAQAEQHVSDARLQHLQRVMEERTARQRAIAEARSRLQDVRKGLVPLGHSFVSRCVDDTWEAFGAQPHQGAIPLELESAVRNYAEAVRDEVEVALGPARTGVSPITIPPFDVSNWMFRLHVDPATDASTQAGVNVGEFLTRLVDGGKAGREAGAALGGWIGKNVLGAHVEAGTLRKIKSLAETVLLTLQCEAERYITLLLGLLVEAESPDANSTRASSEVEEAESNQPYLAALLHWCEGFVLAVRSAIDDLGVTPS